MEKPTPRINSSLREKYVGKTIRLIGKLHSLSGNTAVLTSTDNGQVLVKLNGESQWGTDYVEVIGLIEPDFTLREFKTTNLGNSFDLELANKVVEYGQKCPEIFE
ncbi:replication factor A protein 3 [Cokeromyces recurvatus]|uniref:replication factor A protein 3 n=1 Tax=Cokeromyces recurvatus TaxID=90255 RepID=UPI00221F72B9|nr:replication factor A protein 3 [Cokeromyces recurvatus]KAI7901782.1 replication factor A protein 3 [Cokeromyces recurvatus]